MIRLYGLIPGIEIDLKYTGLRPGEKLYEELLADAENTMPTYHEKIMIAKVRHTYLPEIRTEFESLIALSKNRNGPMELVAKMKELVPEFLSNNSVFEKLDKGNNVVSINIAKVG